MNLCRIDELFNIEKGSLQSSKCEHGKYNFITAAEEWKTHKEHSHECEALIFAAAASGSLGRTHYVNGKFIASDLCFILTPQNPQKNPINLKFYQILFNEIKNDLVEKTKAGTSKYAINMGNFSKFKIPYFEYDRQIAIKETFVSANEIKCSLSSELSHQLDIIKKLRQQILQDAVQGNLVNQNPDDEPASVLLEKIKSEKEQLIKEKKFKKDKHLSPIKAEEIPFEIPENWVWCRLGEILNVKSSKRIFAADYKSKGVPFYRSMEIGLLSENKPITNELFISNEKYEEIKEKFGVPKSGDILIACIGASIGNTWVVDKRVFYYKDGNLVLIESISEIDTNFLLSYLNSELFMNSAMERVSGSSYNALTIIKINNTLFPVPPLPEQRRIVAKVESLMRLCDDLEASIRQNQSYTQQLLQAALREALTVV